MSIGSTRRMRDFVRTAMRHVSCLFTRTDWLQSALELKIVTSGGYAWMRGFQYGPAGEHGVPLLFRFRFVKYCDGSVSPLRTTSSRAHGRPGGR